MARKGQVRRAAPRKASMSGKKAASQKSPMSPRMGRVTSAGGPKIGGRGGRK